MHTEHAFLYKVFAYIIPSRIMLGDSQISPMCLRQLRETLGSLRGSRELSENHSKSNFQHPHSEISKTRGGSLHIAFMAVQESFL